MVSVLLNVVALWKQEPRNSLRAKQPAERAKSFAAHWQRFARSRRSRASCSPSAWAPRPSTCRTSMLEPYGGEILKLGVGATTQLTALMAGGALLAFALVGAPLARGGDPYRVAAVGVLVGLVGFSAVIFAEPLDAPTAVSRRRGADRFWRRPVRGRHADRRDGPRRPRHERPGAWAPGAPCRPPAPARRSRSAARCATSSRTPATQAGSARR